jgi:hypothetical protein
MAKKTVATLRTEKTNLTKLIITEKSPKTGAYTFREMIVSADKIKDFVN